MIERVRAITIRPLMTSLALVAIFGFSGFAFASDKACEGTLEFYQQLQKAKRADPKYGQIPQFLNPTHDIKLSKDWKGEGVPRLFQGFLPEGVTLISHQLRDSKGEGIVKDPGAGEFVNLRVTMPWNGQEVGFNISLPASSLAGNLNRKDKWLIGPEAEAALDWGHGGGTKTTGNHTSVALMSHLFKYGVSVIAMDQPWHGEGARNYFKDADDFFAFRVAFLKKYVHPDVPIFGVGHSMGGLFADMMMRRSTDPKIGIRDVYKGLISLSGVADHKPGASFEEKTHAERVHDLEQKWPHVAARIAPGDLQLGENLVRAGKVSPLSMMFVQFMNLFHDWQLPKDLGKDFLPTLYVWGEADYLYVGNEELFEKYLTPIQSVTLKTFTPRIDFKGRAELVGHLIFDHGRAMDNPVAGQLIVKFMREQDPKTELLDSELMQAFFDKYLKTHYTPASVNNPSNMTSEAFLAAGIIWVPEFNEFVTKESFLVAKVTGHRDVEQLLVAPKDETEKQKAERERKIEDVRRAYLKQFNHDDKPETYTLVREFIEQHLGHSLEVKKNNSTLVGLTRVFQSLGNVLPFREFVAHAELRTVKPAEGFAKLNERGQVLMKFLNGAKKVAKNKNLTAEQQKAQLEELGIPTTKNYLGKLDEKNPERPMTMEEIQEEFALIDKLRTRTYVPQEKKELAEKNLADREALQAEIKKAGAERDVLKRQQTPLAQDVHRAWGKLDTIMAEAKHPDLAKIHESSEEALVALMKTDEDVRNGIDAFIGGLYANNKLSVENQEKIPPQLQEVIENFEANSKIYQEIMKQTEELARQLALAGELGPQAHELAQLLMGQDGKSGLESQLLKLNQELNTLEGQIHNLKQREQDLVEEYVTSIAPGYFVIEHTKFSDLVEMDFEKDWENVVGPLQKFWGQWGTLWAERPPAETVELY